MVYPESIPDPLKARDQWICWRTADRDGTPTKVPIDPETETYASVSDPGTWTTYRDAYTHYNRNDDVAGLGYVFTADGPYAGIDIDDARDPETGMLEEWVIDILLTLGSYTERSPSRSGYHVIAEGTVPDEGHRNGQLELYDQDRYFTVTGDHVPGTPRTIEQRDDALTALHREYIADQAPNSSTDPVPDRTAVPATDAELVEKAMNAANGDKFERLWNGDTSNYPSHSEADQALCNLLAFWTGGDEKRIERLFEQSGLVRDKWRDREDYRERTIRKAVRDCPAYYDG
ncbi:phage NrS-1 polymerase family protein [Halobiforma nitratireducens]|uniref:NrS-1 polymerase-like HBD domain-containing protein n=1 Tax=Halobiforma nitratireducens JCM 10879 TaxID=1227454 RepID=M0M3I1_9EURY|nr:hypothetical protein [Halobiforma nitratireducens]EMA39164.1 hypothetical protein C446_08846 [Halobiforma nitratireducens JCM 10879]